MQPQLYILVLALFFHFGVSAQFSRFDIDTEKWTANDDAIGNQVFLDNARGNPPPSIFARDSDTGLPWYFVAPDCFTGNRAYIYDDTIRYDIFIEEYGFTQYTNDITFFGANGMNLIHNHDNDPLPGIWTTYAVPIRPQFWHIGNGNGPNPTPAQFIAVLSNLAGLEIRGEYKTGPDRAWLDNVIMGETPNQYIQATICEGESYQVGNYSHSATGTYLDELEDQNGCDSVLIYLDLTVLPAYLSSMSDEFCAGGSYTLPDGSTTNQAGFYSFDYQTQDGCDSTFILQLSETQGIVAESSMEFCQGSFYTLPDGSTTNQAGFYSFDYQTQDGCDSTFILELIEVQYITQELNSGFCQGSFYILPDGSLTDTAGIYEYQYITPAGCDSLVRLTLVEQPSQNSTFEASFCQGETYTLPDGKDTAAAGVYSFIYFTEYGCDSSITVRLTQHDTAFQTQYDTICNGDVYTLPNGNTVGVKGIYMNELSTIYGCDSTVLVQLEVLDSSLMRYAIERCENNPYVLPDGSVAAVDGDYIMRYAAASGCDSTEVFNVKYWPNFDTSYQVLLGQGTSYTLPDGHQVVDTIFNAFFILPTENGCDSSIALRVEYVFYNVYAPNVIQPNESGENDFFTLFGNHDLSRIVEMRIYDRWGELVFEKRDFEPNQEAFGWNGIFNGKPVDPAVFVWAATVEFRDGTTTALHGNLTVVR